MSTAATPSPAPPPAPASMALPCRRRLALRAALPGLAVAAVGGTAVLLSGRLPDGAGAFVAAGCAAAAVTGAVGVGLKARVVAAPAASGDARASAQQLQIAVLGDFALQLLAIGTAMVGAYLGGVKFPAMAGLGLAFATVALAHQLGSGLVLARALQRRAPASSSASPALTAARPASSSARPASNPGGQAQPAADGRAPASRPREATR